MTTAMEKMKDAPMSENFLFLSFSAPNFWFYFLFIFPLLTMRLFAEEEKTGTLETLMTAPVTSSQVVMSKYVASFAFYALLWSPILLHLKLFTLVTGNPPPVEMGHLRALHSGKRFLPECGVARCSFFFTHARMGKDIADLAHSDHRTSVSNKFL